MNPASAVTKRVNPKHQSRLLRKTEISATLQDLQDTGQGSHHIRPLLAMTTGWWELNQEVATWQPRGSLGAPGDDFGGVDEQKLVCHVTRPM